MPPDFGHKALVEPQVVDSGQNGPKHFTYVEEMADGGPWEIFAGVAIAGFFNGAGVADMLVISHTQGAFACESVGISGVSGWKDAIEHIYASGNGGDNISGHSDAHKVPGFIFR